MTDFSRDPLDVLAENRGEGITGLYFQQGVPILDRDLNLLQDLVLDAVRSVVSRYLGSGVPLDSGAFAVKEAAGDNDFTISAGTGSRFCLVEGIEVQIENDTTYKAARERWGSPALAAPTATEASPRTDTVYLDVYLEILEEGELVDNDEDIGVPTTVRQKPTWGVWVQKGPGEPRARPGHHYFPLAELTRSRNEERITAAMIRDLRGSFLTLPQVVDKAITPRIDKIDPPQAGSGAPVTILGRNFHITPTSVRFGTAAPITTFTEFTPNQIKLPVPAVGAGATTVTVTTDGGSATTRFTVISG